MMTDASLDSSAAGDLPSGADADPTTNHPGEKLPSLKILMVMNFRWSRSEGGPRTSIDLADEFQQLGHSVSKFDLVDAGATRWSKFGIYFAEFLFRRAAIRHVRRVAAEYDVIQAEPGVLPLSKRALGFEGLLVARSNGLRPLYRQWEATAERKRRQARLPRPGTLIGNFLRRIAVPCNTTVERINKSFQTADLVVTINRDEFRYVAHELNLPSKVVMLPNGLREEEFARFQQAMPSIGDRFTSRCVAFVGLWSDRKGAEEFPRLIRRVRTAAPDVRFLLLGTYKPAETVLRNIAAEDQAFVRVIPRYEPGDLPDLLAQASVAVMPSYVEGFPLAVLETLASGLPTRGYDANGTREMLQLFQQPAMVPAGDVDGLARLVNEVLSLPIAEYAALSDEAKSIARRFRWNQIARDWLDAYARAGPRARARSGDGGAIEARRRRTRGTPQ